MYFDTGSSDFTVSSTACSSSSCGTKNRYNVASSSTAVKTSKTITTSFVDGTSSSGTLVDDTVGIAGLTATGQDIIAATSLSSTVADLESDGLYDFSFTHIEPLVLTTVSSSFRMGLAYPSLSQALSSSLPFTLYKQSQGGRPQWFSLNLKSSGTSQIVFGGYNRAKIGTAPTRWFTSKLEDGTTSHTYWSVHRLSTVFVSETDPPLSCGPGKSAVRPRTSTALPPSRPASTTFSTRERPSLW